MGYSYTATAAYESLGDGLATITALADALPDKQDAALGAFIDALARLSAGRIQPEDLEAVRNKTLEALAGPNGEADRLLAAAVDLLAGRPVRSAEKLRAELSSTTCADVHQVVLHAMNSALLQVPQGHTADWAGYVAAPTFSATTIVGTRYHAKSGSGADLVIGTDGVSLVTPGGAATVRFDECVAKLAWPDGGRRLIGADGISVNVEPTLHTVDPGALHTIDARVHPAKVIWMPARPVEAIPQPKVTPPAARSVRPRSRRDKVTMVVCGVIGVIWGLFWLLGTIGVATDPKTDWGDWATWFVLAVVWLIELGIIWPIVRIGRRSTSKT